MIYNFRFDKSNVKKIINRLKNEKVLSQGWGGGEKGGLSLDGKDIDFVIKAKDFYVMKTTRILSNLTRIRNFKNSDLLVTPNIPKPGYVSIHIVEGDFPDCYEYIEDDNSHQNHRIKVQKSYGMNCNINMNNDNLLYWKAKLPWMRLPVFPCEKYEDHFNKIIKELDTNPDKKFIPSDLAEYLEKKREKLLSDLQEELNKIPPSGGKISFESVCANILENVGYTIIKKNTHRNGGDVDLICIRKKEEVSPFESGESTLIVQVKKHVGTTKAHAVDQVIKMFDVYPQADGCVMSLADNFGEIAQNKADESGITLVNGKMICSLLLKQLGSLEN